MNIDRLLKPQVIAVIGANERKGSFGNYSAVNALQNDQSKHLYFINARADSVLGRKAYKSLSELPEVPDCIMIATPKPTVEPLLEEAGKLGVGAAIIVAAGYSEEGTEEGHEAERRLLEIAHKYDMCIMGPNCTGYINNIDKVKMWGMGGSEFDMYSRNIGVAFFAQSGTMAIHSVSCPYTDVSYSFSMGNSSMVMIEDLLEYVLEEDEVKIIAIYMEGARDGAKLLRCFKKARDLGKPVILHAAGMSKKGAAAAASHTGNLASSREIYRAICRKYGVILVESIDEFLCATNTMSALLKHPPKGGNVSAINGSGGENAVAADLCEMFNVPLPDYEPETIEKLKELLPAFSSPKNPLDMTAITDDVNSLMQRIFTVVGSDPNVDIIIFSVASFAEPNEKDLRQAEVMGESLNERFSKPIRWYVKQKNAVPIVVIPMIEDRRDASWRSVLKEDGVPIMGNSLVGYKVLGELSRYFAYKAETRRIETAEKKYRKAVGKHAYTEKASREILERAGIPFPKQAEVLEREELPTVLTQLRTPLVMKISSPDIQHKTEAGGVVLNINSVSEAEEAYDQIMTSCKSCVPDARLEGVLIQEMAPKGVEMIVGVTKDSQFGPMIMVGMGGIFVEVFKDVASALCPVSQQEAMEMIDSLKAVKLLNGYRGAPACDKSALADTIVKLSEFAWEQRDTLCETDINPIIVYQDGKGVLAVDALVITDE